MTAMSTIHKQVLTLTSARILGVQTFEVPLDAEMVDIQWDPRRLDCVAFWYKISVPDEGAAERPVKLWSFYIRRSGDVFPEGCYHLATVVRDGFAWHVLDADGNNIEWAPIA
jgi:hypothetical protein